MACTCFVAHSRLNIQYTNREQFILFSSSICDIPAKHMRLQFNVSSDTFYSTFTWFISQLTLVIIPEFCEAAVLNYLLISGLCIIFHIEHTHSELHQPQVYEIPSTFLQLQPLMDFSIPYEPQNTYFSVLHGKMTQSCFFYFK